MFRVPELPFLSGGWLLAPADPIRYPLLCRDHAFRGMMHLMQLRPFDISLASDRMSVICRPGRAAPVTLMVRDETRQLGPGESAEIQF